MSYCPICKKTHVPNKHRDLIPPKIFICGKCVWDEGAEKIKVRIFPYANECFEELPARNIYGVLARFLLGTPCCGNAYDQWDLIYRSMEIISSIGWKKIVKMINDPKILFCLKGE